MSKLKDIEWLFNGRHFDREMALVQTAAIKEKRRAHRYLIKLKEPSSRQQTQSDL